MTSMVGGVSQRPKNSFTRPGLLHAMGECAIREVTANKIRNSDYGNERTRLF